MTQAFVPLVFPAGDAGQFNWCHEQVELGGVVQTIKLADFRLAYSRQAFLVAYSRESLEMVFDTHDRAFRFWGRIPRRMIYDNPQTLVNVIKKGKQRRFNRQFLALANHYMFEPVACTLVSGWKKGQVENQVGNVREWLFNLWSPSLFLMLIYGGKKPGDRLFCGTSEFLHQAKGNVSNAVLPT